MGHVIPVGAPDPRPFYDQIGGAETFRRLVARFYGERLTPVDMLRIVTGKPPVPFFSALKVLLPPRRMESPA